MMKDVKEENERGKKLRDKRIKKLGRGRPGVCSTLLKISLLALFGLFNTVTN